MRSARDLVGMVIAALSVASCVGTTGSDLVTFDAAASGPADAVAGAPLDFVSGRGFRVSLTRAKVHVGAVYLNRARPVSGAQETSCILPGIYVAEVTQGLDVDALSPDPQPFPAKGEGTADRAIVGEVWLTSGDVNVTDDTTVMLDVAGTAEKGGVSYPFQGIVTIGTNREIPATDPALPGQNPICKERIVSPIDLDITPRDGGSLRLRVDPRAFFANVDFAKLERVSDEPLVYAFGDASEDQPSLNLYEGLRAREGAYRFTWESSK